MRFFLKALKWTCGLETKHTIRSITVDVRPRAWTYGPKCAKDFILTSHPVVTPPKLALANLVESLAIYPFLAKL